jgi:hypothetical protein
MTSLDRWLVRLSFDDRSRRAITEAALDWQHEVATAPTLTSRLSRHVQSSAGFVRLMARLASREGGDAAMAGWVAWLLCWLALLMWRGVLGATRLASNNASGWMILGWFSTLLFNAIPVAMALAIFTGRSKSRSPVMAFAIANAAIAALIAFALIPMYLRFGAPFGGRPFPTAVIVRQIRDFAFALEFGTALVLLANAVRQSPRRWAMTGATACALVVGRALMRGAVVAAYAVGSFTPFVVSSVPLIFVALYIPAVWIVFSRWNERTDVKLKSAP